MMEVYNATIRLQSSLANEVLKRGLTVPELLILQRIHGNDAVVKIAHAGYVDVDDIDERDRLNETYGQGLNALGEDQKTSVEKMFGGDYNPLPKKLRGYDGDMTDKTGTLEEFQAHPIVEQPDLTKLKKESRKAATKAIPPTAKGSKALEAVL